MFKRLNEKTKQTRLTFRCSIHSISHSHACPCAREHILVSLHGVAIYIRYYAVVRYSTHVRTCSLSITTNALLLCFDQSPRRAASRDTCQERKLLRIRAVRQRAQRVRLVVKRAEELLVAALLGGPRRGARRAHTCRRHPSATRGGRRRSGAIRRRGRS